MDVNNSVNTTKGIETTVQPVRTQVTTQATAVKVDVNIDTSTTQNNGKDIIDRVKARPEYKPSIAEETVIKAIETANKKLSGIQAEFQFGVHEATKQITLKVINKETKEVIRELPPEKTLDMVAKMWELAGLLVDERR